jgi:hypothetical protein
MRDRDHSVVDGQVWYRMDQDRTYFVVTAISDWMAVVAAAVVAAVDECHL